MHVSPNPSRAMLAKRAGLVTLRLKAAADIGQ